MQDEGTHIHCAADDVRSRTHGVGAAGLRGPRCKTKALIFTALLMMIVASCGGGGSEEFAANCSISRSELGPFSSDTPLGVTMDERQARAAMAETGFSEWIEIRADGTWNEAWDVATPILGQGIHQDLSWIDAAGEITDLYESGDSYGFEELRISRSFQGKIEHSRTPLFIGVEDSLGEPNYDADCEITALTVGDEQNPELLDVLDAVAFPSG